MRKLLTAFSAALLLIFHSAPDAYAQKSSPTTEADVPWLYEGSDVPVDKSWTFGQLSNGLRYAVKKNTVPARQISIRVRIDAGSLYEKEDERGFAHLIEHLAFRGSEYVPDGESKRIWQRFGATFGSDSNALTTPTQTVYKLDLPNSSPAKFDESMKILSGMMRAPNITDAALNAERAIVLAEMRESSGAAKEMGDALRAHIFRGQPLAERSPIGTPETLNASTTEGLIAFHKRWYRPEKTVIVIAGDAAAETLEAAIKTHFGSWNVPGKSAAQPSFGKPASTGDKAKVYIEPSLPLAVSLAWMRPWEKVDDTIVYNEGLLLDALATQIINRRLATMARRGGDFLYAEVSRDDISRSADVTTVTLSPVGDDWEKAVAGVRAVIADAIATPPSDADIERERVLFARALQTRLDSYAFEAAAIQADNIVQAVDIRETVAAPDTVVDVFANMRSKITPENILASTRKLFEADSVRIFMTSPNAVENGQKRLAASLNQRIDGNAAARLAQEDINFDDLPKLGKPGQVTARNTKPLFEMEQVAFENGVRALLYPNKAENGQIRMVVRFGRGYQAVAPQDAELLWTGPMVINESGIDKFDQTQVEQLVNGRRIQLAFGIDDGAFEYSATTSTADLADQLKLIATKMEYPGWNKAPLARAQAFIRTGYESFQMSAGAILERDLIYLLSGSDKRWKTPTPAEADKVTFNQVRKFWEPILKAGPIEVIIMGDFEKEVAIQALAQSFGAMKPRNTPISSKKALTKSFPRATSQPVLRQHNGPADQAAAAIAWPTAGGLSRITESRELEVLAAVFRDRLFEKFRAEQAASYSPNMSNNWPDEFYSGGYMMAISLVQPKDVDRFFAFSEDVARDLATNPISQDELKRAVEPLKQLLQRIASGNTFWMNELEGASYNPQKFTALRRLFTDYDNVTPVRLQQLAQRYFVQDKAWKLKVLPKNIAANDSVPTGGVQSAGR